MCSSTEGLYDHHVVKHISKFVPGFMSSPLRIPLGHQVQPFSVSVNARKRHQQKISFSTHARTQRVFTLSLQRSNRSSNNSGPFPSLEVAAGGKGPLSGEFLTVTGLLATLLCALVLVPTTLLVKYVDISLTSSVKQVLVAICSFAYGVFLSRFDLKKTNTLKLTVVFGLLTRVLCFPILSHLVAVAGCAVVKLSTAKKAAEAAAAAAAAINAATTVAVTKETLSLPADVLSSLFLLSVSPSMYSPSTAMLSSYVHTTLLAILTVLTVIIFPILPVVSYKACVWAQQSAWLNMGSILPKLTPPPNFVVSALCTTVPFLTGLSLKYILPKRISAITGLFAYPVAWICSFILIISSIKDVATGSITGLAGSIGLCGGVVLLMWVLGRGLAYALKLDERAKRTLILYLCSQGVMYGTGLSPAGFATSPHVASGLVGLAFGVIMGRFWSKVVIKTSTDVIL